MAFDLSINVDLYMMIKKYAMIKFAAQHEAVDERGVMLESLTSIARAGAEIIITYFTRDFFAGLETGENR